MKRALVSCAPVVLLVLVAASLAGTHAAPPSDVEALLREKLALLRAEADQLRARAAAAELELTSAAREIVELRQYIRDHREFGDDFARYEAVMVAAEADALTREREANQQKREAALAERQTRALAIRAQRERGESIEARVERYRDAGFTAIGSDVFAGRMSYSYATRDSAGAYIDYDPTVGLYYRPWGVERVDFGRMTISGAVLNASAATRNIAIAITFYDEGGNQVGSETVQLDGALPDVPYPFTSSIEMALDRPFTSSNTYVLYAEPVE